MYRNGRCEDQVFDPDELLYRRCCLNEVSGDRLLSAAIDFPDWSVNRSKYSNPKDVLYPSGKLKYSCCGVAAFHVSDIPESLESGEQDNISKFKFKVSHAPEDDNYSHSEVLTYKNGINGKTINNFKKKISKKIKKDFRTRLGDKIRVIINPDQNTCINQS